MKTFEMGSTEARPSLCLYFVVKGGMKLKSRSAIADKNSALGSIRSFYSSAYEEND